MNIAINYSETDKQYRFYEDTTETLLLSESLLDGLLNLNTYLIQSGAVSQGSDLFRTPGIMFHLDSWTMNQIVQHNVSLAKRILSGPSEFKNSQDKFGVTSSQGGIKGRDFGHASKGLSQGNLGHNGFTNNKKWAK